MALRASPDIRLICFDLDGTLVDRTTFIWSTLHEHFGCDPRRRQQAAKEHREGRISYEQWFHTDLQLLRERGADRPGMLRALTELRATPGAAETLSILKERGYKLGIISGSVDLVLEHFFPDSPFDHVLINRLHFAPDGAIIGGIPTPYDLEGKAQGLKELARRENIATSQCAFVGDNLNDLPVMRQAGFSVGVNIKSPQVAETVDVVCPDPDLRSILPLFPGPSEA